MCQTYHRYNDDFYTVTTGSITVKVALTTTTVKLDKDGITVPTGADEITQEVFVAAVMQAFPLAFIGGTPDIPPKV